jgi:uncharacterized protein (DUF2147 family)
MIRSNLSLPLAGCAALAVGIIGGWTALALMPAKTPAVEAPAESVPTQQSATTQPSPEKSSAPPAKATPPPPAPAKEVPAVGGRNVAASGPTGVWIDHTGRGAVEITDCAGALCGRIVWLKDAGNKSVCGKQVIGSAKRTSAGTWDGGWIYDPERGARYSVELKLLGPDKLRVMGYMGSKMFSETYTWRRATVDLARCDAAPVTASPSPAPNDPNPAATETTKAKPPGEFPDSTPKSGKPSLADLEKIARDMIKSKPGGKGCTMKLPYVGTVTVPCPD